MLAVNHGYGRAPVTLTADQPVAQTVVGLECALALLFQLLYDGNLALLGAHARELAGVDHHAVFGEGKVVVAVHALDHALDGQTELLCEHEVALVVSGNAHDRARAVARDDIVRDEYGHLSAVDGVDCVCARHDARLFAVAGKTVDFRDLGGFPDIILDGFPALGSGDFAHQRIFGGEHNIGHAESRVGAGGEHAEFLIATLDGKLDFAAVGFAYPVLLHELGLFGPVQLVQPLQKLLGVIRYLEKPLGEVLAHHRRPATLALALHDLLVGKHGVAGGAPVHGRFLAVGKPFLVHLQEQPLRPLVVLGRAGVKLVVPVVHRTDFLELPFHGGDVLHGAVLGVYARLYRVVFGGQTERVEAHGLEHFVALHLLETRIGVGGTVVIPVPRMKFCARRIGEHLQHIPLLVDAGGVELVEPRLLPYLLPLAFDFQHIHIDSVPLEINLCNILILPRRKVNCMTSI